MASSQRRSQGTTRPSGPEPRATLDETLLSGFRFSCRPDCGLCCFTSPSVSAAERHELLHIAPDLSFFEPPEGGPSEFWHLKARPEGGACQALTSLRCRVHEARPFPCRSFPVVVHEGLTWQATLVLSCPGLDVSNLPAWADPTPPSTAPVGLEREIRCVREEWERNRREGMGERVHPRSAHQRRQAEAQELRSQALPQLLRRLPWPQDEDFPAEAPPGADSDLEELPLSFDETHGRLALREEEGGWTALTLREQGGVSEVLGTYPDPSEAPQVDEEAKNCVRGYLAYVARREHFWGLVDGTRARSSVDELVDEASSDLRTVGAMLLARSSVLAQLHGRGGARLSRHDVELGVRAVDADLLDRAGSAVQL